MRQSASPMPARHSNALVGVPSSLSRTSAVMAGPGSRPIRRDTPEKGHKRGVTWEKNHADVLGLGSELPTRHKGLIRCKSSWMSHIAAETATIKYHLCRTNERTNSLFSNTYLIQKFNELLRLILLILPKADSSLSSTISRTLSKCKSETTEQLLEATQMW